jgi:hypothetical protein
MNVSESLEKVESGSDFEVWRFRSTTLHIEWARPGIIAFTVVGHGHAEFAAPCLRRWNVGLRKCGRLTLLSDLWDMPTYDSGFRLAVTDWCVRNRARLEPSHVLMRSQIVSMGVAVANLALGGLFNVYTLRASYDAAVQKLGVPSRRVPST